MNRIYKILRIEWVRPLTPQEHVIAILTGLWVMFNLLLICGVDSIATEWLLAVPLSFWGNYKLAQRLPDIKDEEEDEWE